MIQRYIEDGREGNMEKHDDGEWVRYDDHLSAVQAQAKACAEAFIKEYETISRFTFPDGRDHLWRRILNAKPEEK